VFTSIVQCLFDAHHSAACAQGLPPDMELTQVAEQLCGERPGVRTAYRQHARQLCAHTQGTQRTAVNTARTSLKSITPHRAVRAG
jgi:hypothetical protein